MVALEVKSTNARDSDSCQTWCHVPGMQGCCLTLKVLRPRCGHSVNSGARETWVRRPALPPILICMALSSKHVSV